MKTWSWKWNPWARKKNSVQEIIERDRLLLVKEIQKAHLEWEIAQKRFDYVMEKDEIDYAVFALEAAEKRFEMLLKQAKGLKISMGEVCESRRLEGQL